MVYITKEVMRKINLFMYRGAYFPANPYYKKLKIEINCITEKSAFETDKIADTLPVPIDADEFIENPLKAIRHTDDEFILDFGDKVLHVCDYSVIEHEIAFMHGKSLILQVMELSKSGDRYVCHLLFGIAGNKEDYFYLTLACNNLTVSYPQ